jgi:putative endonuclease
MRAVWHASRPRLVVHNLAGGDPRGPAAGYGPGMAGIRPSTDERLQLGRLGEELAATLLEAAGLRVVARNWRCREGEIDLGRRRPRDAGLLQGQDQTRQRLRQPSGRRHHRQAGQAAPAGSRLPGHRPGRAPHVRFDVVAVTWPRGAPPATDHLQGVL